MLLLTVPLIASKLAKGLVGREEKILKYLRASFDVKKKVIW